MILLSIVSIGCADDEGWMQLRGRNLSLYLLDKTRLKAERTFVGNAEFIIPYIYRRCWGGIFAWEENQETGRGGSNLF